MPIQALLFVLVNGDENAMIPVGQRNILIGTPTISFTPMNPEYILGWDILTPTEADRG